MSFDQKKFEPFRPNTKEREMLSDWYTEWQKMYILKNQTQDILAGRTLQEFWDQSNVDYENLTQAQLPNDPVVNYSSGITRDKADVFISNLIQKMMRPGVTAQNSEQEIDYVMSRVSDSLLEWQHNNDGFPSESGHQKFTRYVHKDVIEGTIHIQDDVDSDGLRSSLVPNEEIFIPNFWQSDLQLQSRLYRVQNNITYDEAQEEFGMLDRFKHVMPGSHDYWYYPRPKFKEWNSGILEYNRVQVIYGWVNCSPSEILKLKRQNKISKNVKRAKYFNVLINGVPMFEADNLSPYRDGLYPISKGIFVYHSKPEYYWGNSLPNKIHEDKKWRDAWKTLLRFKGKMGALPPTRSNRYLESDIYIPGRNTVLGEEVKIDIIPGTDKGLTDADVRLAQMVDQEIDRATVAPSSAGQVGDSDRTARQVVIEDSNANKLLDAFSLQIAFLINARTFPILYRTFQFLPRKKIKKISIPQQTLSDGSTGNLEIIFEKQKELSQEELLLKSRDIALEEQSAKTKKNPKNKVYIDPSYLEELELYIKTDPKTGSINQDAITKAQYDRNYDRYIARPDLYDIKEVARTFVRKNGDDERLINKVPPQTQPQNNQPIQNTPQGQGTNINSLPQLSSLS